MKKQIVLCWEWSGELSCGCCGGVGVVCEKPTGHKGKHRGKFDDVYSISWKGVKK